MATFELAEKLNCIQSVLTKNKTSKHNKQNKQAFDYLLVLDFEATCWAKTSPHKSAPEIIEFPCVLYDIENDKILEEFRKYVRPTEHLKLSKYCIKLTGINQNQVNNGISLGSFSLDLNTSLKSGIFATWSDWDLNECLTEECSRKGIQKDAIFNRWIDIKELFIEHHRYRVGLLAALRYVGLKFEGQQHCGLHDAKNTARLVGKMISDGVTLKVTTDININKNVI